MRALPGSSRADLDVPRALTDLARRLEAAHEADPANAMVARALHSVLRTLAGDRSEGRRVDAVDQLRAEWEGFNGSGV